MYLSKSFGYALRGVLYVALIHKEGRKVQLDEMAEKLKVPRHFLAKIMKLMVKEGILHSTKGPYGGFSLNEHSLKAKLIQLVKITDGVEQFNTCVLSLRKCNSNNPCPLHLQMMKLRDDMLAEFSARTLGDLLDEKNPDFIRSISTLS
jgi:Rrf2 family protein